ncbi:hypothetical protein FACS1894166_10400 [Bacilli bacterium]|nr:hypothetical protein FACS1894166_10400 [Bacilli bacterium]
MNHFKKIKLFINELSNTPATLDKIAELSLEYFGDNILTNNLTYQQFYAEAYEISLILKTKYKIKSAVSIVIDLESSLTYMKMF